MSDEIKQPPTYPVTCRLCGVRYGPGVKPEHHQPTSLNCLDRQINELRGMILAYGNHIGKCSPEVECFCGWTQVGQKAHARLHEAADQ